MKYWFEYTYELADKTLAGRWGTMSTSPIQALNYFHDWVQRHADRDGNRKIIRPKLRMRQYTLTLFKRDGFAPYDLPITPNPDLSERKRVKAEPPPTFNFFPLTAGAGRLAQ